MIRVEIFGIDEFIRDLDRTEQEIDDRAYRVTEKSIGRIKAEATRIIRAGHYGTLPHLHRSFTSSVDKRRDQVVGEAGAELGLLQGRLDVFIEHGTPTSNPHPHWRPAGMREEPRWVNALEDACVEDLERS